MVRITSLLSNRKVFNFTYQTPQETLLGTPETLPTTEPATPQIGYTVASGDLPTVSASLYSRKWIGMVIGAGKAVTAATVSWRMKKNGVSVNTGTLAVTANTFYTIQAWFYDVAVGDLLELALWSNVSDSNWDYKAYQIHITRIFFYNKVLRMTLETTSTIPTLTLGTPTSVPSTWYVFVIHKDYELTPSATDRFYRTASASPQKTFRILYPHETFGTAYTRYGDLTQNDVTTATHATSRPRYSRNVEPAQVTLRYVVPKEI